MSEWIRVEDRLPEEDEDVLAYIQDGYIKVACPFYQIDGGKRWAWFGGDYMYENVTHWQPLPDPPKDGE